MIMQQASRGNDEQLEQLANLFRLLSDRTRLKILLLLADGERNVTSLCDALRLPQPTVSHHLSLLRMSSAISNRREGKQVFYSLDGRVNVDGKVVEIGNHEYVIKIRPRS